MLVYSKNSRQNKQQQILRQNIPTQTSKTRRLFLGFSHLFPYVANGIRNHHTSKTIKFFTRYFFSTRTNWTDTFVTPFILEKANKNSTFMLSYMRGMKSLEFYSRFHFFSIYITGYSQSCEILFLRNIFPYHINLYSKKLVGTWVESERY